MMDIYIMQYKCRSRYLVVINKNTYVSVYKYEKKNLTDNSSLFNQKIYLLVNQGFVI